MAKEDFCFTYYDGDAARDKAHMTRLERGAYDDIISAQRKKGHLSLADIKRVLSKDFDECWPSLEWILLKDGDEKYYIEWVDTSVQKSKANSQKNKERIQEYWRKVEAGEIIPKKRNGLTKSIPRNNNGTKTDVPLGYGNGNEDGNGIVLVTKGGPGEEVELAETGFFANELPKDMELDLPQISNVKEFIAITCKKRLTDVEVRDKWQAFKIQTFGIREWYDSTEKLLRHFRFSIKKEFENGHQNGTLKQNHSHQPIITGSASGAGKL